MNAVLPYEVMDMHLSHEDDGTLHVAFTIYHHSSSSNCVESERCVLDVHVVQEKTPQVETRHPVVSRVRHVPHERLKRWERTNVEPLQEAISPRERDVLKLVAQGLSNQEIAQALVLSVGTVKRHLSNIFAKLHAHNRLQAVVQARQLGMLVEMAASRSLPLIHSTRDEQHRLKNIL
jgi:ATP/maltotriose-dependent transcriptional regulator MalT